MTTRPTSPSAVSVSSFAPRKNALSWSARRLGVSALVACAAPWLSSLVSAQDSPPAPPQSLRIVQQLAQEPTPIGPALPGLNPSEQAPRPEDLPPADPSMAVPEADIEAFARGPVHQAFADVYELDPAPNVIVTVAPPAAVDELPPEQMPTGDNVQWISGYWSWDEESNDYLWVSGVWRDVPPGRRWVLGYWAEVKGGFQFVSGFWTNVESQELIYVPQPPESLEIGPNVPPPSDDQVWVPGNWTYVSDNYQWSPGYYMPCHEEYMWIPNQYTWTPRGCVYVPGYMDYRFARRGTLFSPVRFRRSLVSYGYGRPACYQPSYSVNMSGFLIHLFVRPRCRSFYYGDYYGNQYASIGFTPWYRRTSVDRHCHDPAYQFYRRDSHRHGLDFDHTVNTWHQRYESNRDIRPPRMFHDQEQFLARHQGDSSAQLAVTSHRYDDVVKHHSTGHSFHKMDREDIEVVRENSRVNRNVENARRQTERDVHLVNSGDLKPGQSVDLRLKDAAGRTDRDEHRGHGPEGARAIPEKLMLGQLPEKLQAKSKESVATAERIRQQAGHRTEGKPITGSPLDANREKAAERAKDRTHTGEPANVARDREQSIRKGKTPLLIPPAIDDASKPVANDRASGRPDRTEPKGTSNDQGSGADRLEELRQKMEAQRAARGAGNQSRGGDAPQVVTPTGRNPRILEGGPLVNPKADHKVAPQPDRVIENSAAKPRFDERRQRAPEHRVPRDAGNPAQPVSPTPAAVENRPPRVIEKAPKIDSGAVREPVVREREIPQRHDNPAPVVRQQQQQQPIERTPKMERAPVQQAPRHIERQVPAERAPQAERPSGEERQSSRRKGKD